MIDESERLPLDSQRWRELSTRRGPGASWVSEWIQGLSDGSLGTDAFRQLWPELCSEEQTYDAAYAAAPYFVGLAEQRPLGEPVEDLIVLGLIETYAERVPSDLEPAYRQAIRHAQALAMTRLADCPPNHELRYLLAATAAFRGRRDLAAVLQNLDAIQEACPSCGTVVFPGELQKVIDTDQAS